MNKRPDRLTALRVDLGINIAAARGTLIGAAYLCDIGVPIDVTLRVLLDPAKRRGANRFPGDLQYASAVTTLPLGNRVAANSSASDL